MRPISFLALFILILAAGILAGATGPMADDHGKTRVEARQWSKVDGVVHYSGWKPFYARTIDQLAGFKKADSAAPVTLYGGDPERRFRVTGFYYTVKERGRWWIIDPEGYANINAAVNGVRPGTSPRNEKALSEKYGSNEKWINDTHRQLEALGFNGTACWSETPLIKYSNSNCKTPLTYTLILSLYANYQKEMRRSHATEVPFSVFSPEFEKSVENQAKKIAEHRDDPWLLGYFSDNELNFNSGLLDDYLSLSDHSDPHYVAAAGWLEVRKISTDRITDENREQFLGAVAERYYQVVSAAIRKYDPNHLYLGSRLHSRAKHNKEILKAAGRYCDIISINYYGQWEPVDKHFRDWEEWAGKPVIITEFYTKGDDSGLPNISGAGWRVRTQAERGIFYENFCMKLLSQKNCVGWHWFRYMDNDPTDSTADESNNDSNKGIVNNLYEYYEPLTVRMKAMNDNRYRLINYFDR